MATLADHWTERSIDDFLYRIAADYITQIEKTMESKGIKQSDLARALGVSEGRVSQVLNNPGNLTLRKIAEYARALGKKVSVVSYDDGDSKNCNGPIHSDVFTLCWQRAGKPGDLFALPESPRVTTNVETPIGDGTKYRSNGQNRHKRSRVHNASLASSTRATRRPATKRKN
jgi:transcriptional regulator with XRE-family HTH domain